jgi:23S rRNA (adenine2503-C2)-methyltransferase
MKTHLLSQSKEDLAIWMQEHGQPAFRVDQVLQWVYGRGVDQWQAMTNLPEELKARLEQSFELRSAQLQKMSESADDTLKILLRWPDGKLTETVMIPEMKRRTVCVSSQVGCPVKCKFCASGLNGLERSLHAGEIVEQLLWVKQQLPEGERISNVVMMGMGEPLANYNHVLAAVKIMNAGWGLGVGARHITISSVGLPDRIRKLAHEPLQFTLAISLHAGDEEVRKEIIPWAQRTTTEELFEAIDYFFQHTRREVTLEYIMLDKVNNSHRDADLLAHWAKRSRCNVNLIHYNEVENLPYKRASSQSAQAFKDRLSKRGVNVHIRPSRGRDIDAACGQLRQQYLPETTA